MPKIKVETTRGVALVDYRFKKGGRLEYHLTNAEDFGLMDMGFVYLAGAEMDKEHLLENLVDWIKYLIEN